MKRAILLTVALAIACGGQAMAATVPVFSYEFPASWNGTGTTLVDQSTAGNNATIVSGGAGLSANVPPGEFGNSMDFTGTQTVRTTAIDLLDNPLVEANGGFTMQTWFHPTAGDLSARRKLIDYSGTEAINMENGRLTAYVSDGVRLTHSVPITANTWHKATFVFDTGTNTIDGNGDIRGDVSLTLDGVEETATNVLLTDFGDSLNRPIGLGAHPFGADQYAGLLYNPQVELGVAPPAPVTHEVAGDNTIGTETLTGTQGNEAYGGAPTGRFVQVKNNGTSSRRMDIGEVEVFATGDTPTVDHAGDNQNLNPSIDLAYTGSTAGASVHAKGADSGFTQPHGTDDDGRLIDAKETDGAGVWSSNGVGNFVTIDLGDTFDIGSVRVHQRNGCCQDRLRDFSVNVFADDGTGNPGTQVATASYPGQPPNERFGELSMASLLSADLVASLQPFDAGAGYTYVFELSSNDQIAVDNPDPGIFTTYLDINNADIVVEALGPLAPGEVFQLLDADVITGNYHSLALPPGVVELGDFNETGAVTTAGEIPEPITLLAVGLSLTGLGGYIRRRRRA